MRFQRWLWASAAVALIFGPALYILYADYRVFLDAPLGVPAGGLTLEVEPGVGVADLARKQIGRAHV
jgi:UPF0755 protein